jgi:hypothetical protein
MVVLDDNSVGYWIDRIRRLNSGAAPGEDRSLPRGVRLRKLAVVARIETWLMPGKNVNIGTSVGLSINPDWKNPL